MENPNAIDWKHVDMRMACLFHYDFDVAAMIRFIGGDTIGAHRNSHIILPQVKGLIIKDDVTEDLRRVLTITN